MRETLRRWTINDLLVFERRETLRRWTMNVCIHDFDDVKEESNNAASNNKHLLQE